MARKCTAQYLAQHHQLKKNTLLYWIQLLTENIKLDLDINNTCALVLTSLLVVKLLPKDLKG